MAFVMYEPPESSMINPIGEGECSIAKSGTAMFRPEDLAIVGITDAATILIDTGNLRIGFRKATADALKAVRVKSVGARSKINLNGVLKALSLDAAVAKGRYALTVKESDGILILNLGDGGRS